MAQTESQKVGRPQPNPPSSPARVHQEGAIG
jgi:hypothetical protein